VIELSHVSKTYAPRFGRSARALDDVSLRVAAGEVAGLSGPTGAGKSALIALVLGHERPTSGTVRVDGTDARPFVEREGIGYSPQRLRLPGRWRVVDALTRLAILSGVRAADTRARVDGVLRDLGLTDERRARLTSLHPDVRGRVAIAQAVLADRRVIVLDEPLEGLGAESQELLRDLIVRLRAFDRAILIASRDTAELQRITDRVTLLDRGRVRRTGTARPMTPANVETVFHLVLHSGADHVLAVFPNAISLGKGTYAVRATLAALNRGIRELVDRGALLAAVTPAHAAAAEAAVGGKALDEVAR
jgi:ABC-type multidrug transport system ATPase subunit